VALSLRPALAGSQKVPGVPPRRARLPAARDVLAGHGLGAGDGLAAVAEPEAAVSAEPLRHAAAEMRRQHGPEHVRHEFWGALADLMESQAAWWEDMAIPDPHGLEESPCQDCAVFHRATTVARIYLGASR